MLGALRFFRRHGVIVMVGLLYGYLVLHIVSGNQGLFQLAGYDRDIADLHNQIAVAKGERLRLEKQVSELSPEHLSPDRVEEIARRDLGYSHVNDLVIILDE